jgi:predicted nucleotide-binding protein
MAKRNRTLDLLIKRGRDLLHTGERAAKVHETFVKWDTDVVAYIEKRFPGTGHTAEWSALPFSVLGFGKHSNESEAAWTRFREAVGVRLEWLSRLYKLANATDSPNDATSAVPMSNRVFIVHGRDGGFAETVARFLTKLRFSPVVLHEQPSKGRTIIEKFIENADVGFAVVLLTGDDVGRLNDEASELRPRARQNVVLELGFFLGRLGRERVCAIYEPGVEIPSDYDGVVWVSRDPADAWRLTLAREMKAAGLPVDMNDAI